MILHSLKIRYYIHMKRSRVDSILLRMMRSRRGVYHLLMYHHILSNLLIILPFHFHYEGSHKATYQRLRNRLIKC